MKIEKLKIASYLEGDCIDGDYSIDLTVCADGEYIRIIKNFETNKITVERNQPKIICGSAEDLDLIKKTELINLAKKALS